MVFACKVPSTFAKRICENCMIAKSDDQAILAVQAISALLQQFAFRGFQRLLIY